MWQSFKDWYTKPFSEDMSAAHWFLFLGLLIVLAVLWSLILRTVKEVA